MTTVTKELINQKLGDFLVNYQSLSNFRDLESQINWFYTNLKLYVEQNNHTGDTVDYKYSVEQALLKIIALGKDRRVRSNDPNNN